LVAEYAVNVKSFWPVQTTEMAMTYFKSWRVAAFCCLLTVPAHAQPSEAQILQRLHGSLMLSPAQEGPWQTLEQAYALDPHELLQRRNAAATMRTLSAPQRVDLSVNLSKADLESLERRGAALKAFYGTLSPQQQSIFDRETLPMQPGGD